MPVILICLRASAASANPRVSPPRDAPATKCRLFMNTLCLVLAQAWGRQSCPVLAASWLSGRLVPLLNSPLRDEAVCVDAIRRGCEARLCIFGKSTYDREIQFVLVGIKVGTLVPLTARRA